MQKYKMIDEMQEMKKIYEMMIFEDAKYEPNTTAFDIEKAGLSGRTLSTTGSH